MAILKFLACLVIAREARSGDGSLFWSVDAGPCEMIGDCIQSSNYPKKYGNQEQRKITVISSTLWAINVTAFDTEKWDVLTVNGKSYSTDQGPDGVVPTGTITWTSDLNKAETGWMLCPRPLDADVSTTAVTVADASGSGRPGHRRWFRPWHRPVIRMTPPPSSTGHYGATWAAAVAAMPTPAPTPAGCAQADSGTPLENQPMVVELQSQLRELKNEVAKAHDLTDTYIDVIVPVIDLLQPMVDPIPIRLWFIGKAKEIEGLIDICTASVLLAPKCLPWGRCFAPSGPLFAGATSALKAKAKHVKPYVSEPLKNIKEDLASSKDEFQDKEQFLDRRQLFHRLQ